MKINAVIFDLDGTILDTERLNAVVAGEILGEMGHEMPDFMQWYSDNCRGHSIVRNVRLFQKVFNFTTDEADFVARVRALRKTYVAQFPQPIKAGAVELFDFLRAQKIKMGIASGAFVPDIISKLQSAGISPEFFGAVVGGDIVKNPKPDPETYFLAMQGLRAKPETTLVIEDSVAGATAGISAGCRTILCPDVPDPTQKPNTDKRSNPPEIAGLLATVTTLDEIIDIVRRANSLDTCPKK